MWQQGFTETSVNAAGAGILGLNAGSRSVTSLPLFLGTQVDTSWMLPNGTMLAPQVRASWVHEFFPDRQVDASFIMLPDAAFTVQGARAARDAAKLTAEARWFFNPAAFMFASADSEMSNSTTRYSLNAGFKSNW